MAVLLEREHELEVLEDVVRGLPSGGGCLVLVAGEAGAGKTSLLREVRARSAGRPAFLIGSCAPLSVPAPLESLREIAEEAGGDDAGAAAAGDAVHVARRLLAALASRSPVVAVVEDAHWADPTTLDVVRLLARRVEGTAIGLVVTYRDDETGANPALAQLVGDLATSQSVRRIRLGPLSETAVRGLAAAGGVDPAPVMRMTGGNPFLVTEVIAAGGHLPRTVTEATLARVGRLGSEARALVEVVAVAGQRVSPSLVEALAPGGTAAVEEALARGVLVADGDVLGFRHELTREAIEAAIAPPRRAGLHGRVFDALAVAFPDADNARLAHHAELAARSGDACRYAALAAADAERLGALREASLQAERALRLGRRLGERERFELLVLRARSANFASSRLADASEAAEAAVALGASLGDPLLHGRALLVLASALWSADHVVEARDAAARAAVVLDATDDLAERARARALQVRIEATAFDPARALEAAAPALELARVADADQVALDVDISIALAHGHLGEPRALELLATALRAARKAELSVQTIRAYVNLTVVAMHLRRHDLIDATVAEALPLFEGYGTPIPANALLHYRGRSLLDRGRLDEALAIVTLPGRNWAAETPVVQATAALVAGRRGEGDAVGPIERAFAQVGRLPENSRRGMLRTALVEAAWLAGDGPRAVAALRDAVSSPTAASFVRPASDLAVWARRYGIDLPAPENAPEAVHHELAGDWRRARRAWLELGAPYEAALAALHGDDRAAREATAMLQRLGAMGAARAFSRERGAQGARSPRGPRPATAVHPAGLTRREQEVLEQIATGATNAAIASSLHLSERTVAHHVSAILRKLAVRTRLGAIEEARRRELLPKMGSPSAQDGPT